MDNAFDYEPLVGINSTRVLSLLPSASLSDPIDVRLFEVDLSHNPPFEALSYAWGDGRTKVAINCSGKELHVTRNCDTALRHLRLPNTTRTLWVDAICIDQREESIAERNQQVKIMGDIYSSASRVLIWLGEATPFQGLAIRFLARFENIMNASQYWQDVFAARKYRLLRGISDPDNTC
jgi:hypothetical protein